MAPTATNDSATATNGATNGTDLENLKAAAANAASQLFNPFYSPTVSGDGGDADYKYAKYKVRPLPSPLPSLAPLLPFFFATMRLQYRC